MANVKTLANRSTSKEIAKRGPAPIAKIEYSKANIDAWDRLEGIERIALSEVRIKPEYGATVAGNLVERLELPNGPNHEHPNGTWNAYRIELIRPIPMIEDKETGEVFECVPGDFVLVPETAMLSALVRYVGSCIGIRPKGKKRLGDLPDGTPRNPMWLYEGVLISREPMQVTKDGQQVSRTRG